jgi:uncharacterized protein
MEPPPAPPPPPRQRRRRFVLAAGVLVLLAFIAANFFAFMQARAMTHFGAGSLHTPSLEEITLTGKIRVLFCGVSLARPENHSTPSDFGLPFQTVRFGGPQNDDCEAWYIPATQSRGLCIAFHGYAAAKSSLLPVGQELHDMGYDVMLVDFPGSGGSRGNQTTHGYREADNVADAVDYAHTRWNPRVVVLYGQSMGGAAILRAVAKLNVRPSGVIVESTYDRLLSITENRFHAMGLPAFPLDRLLVFWGGWQFGYNAFEMNPADYAASVHCPVLVFQGGRDLRVTNQQAKNLFDNLAGPRQFELFETSGHCGFLADDPHRWENTESAFLANLKPK